MPRKIRDLKRDLAKAGFAELARRGEGSHSMWSHPEVPEAILLSGANGDDAVHYQEKQVRVAIAKSRERTETSG